ncbi:hypothetical protein AAY473_013682 [Plecturocebus cupreus]
MDGAISKFLRRHHYYKNPGERKTNVPTQRRKNTVNKSLSNFNLSGLYNSGKPQTLLSSEDWHPWPLLPPLASANSSPPRENLTQGNHRRKVPTVSSLGAPGYEWYEGRGWGEDCQPTAARMMQGSWCHCRAIICNPSVPCAQSTILACTGSLCQAS